VQIESGTVITFVSNFIDQDFLRNNGFNDKTAWRCTFRIVMSFFWNTSAEDLGKRMLKEYARFWNDKTPRKGQKSLELTLFRSHYFGFHK